MGFVGIVWALVGLLAAVVAYAAVCLVLLFYVSIPDDGPYLLLDDARFAFTLPFAVGVVLATSARSLREARSG